VERSHLEVEPSPLSRVLSEDVVGRLGSDRQEDVGVDRTEFGVEESLEVSVPLGSRCLPSGRLHMWT